MKTILFLLLVTALCFGCSTRYDITMANGTKITAVGKPKLSPDKSAWYFTDAKGNPSRISAGSVDQIAPQSSDKDDKFKFNAPK